ncbi:MAG: undecaprenyl-diphosphate phosphatase [Clostridia bacterium]|nr:undecaprenyl-diphosphate phosphatase [Clostridia bacterium]MBT7123090.1 undecaprenyl-diphosphate phosphatase [Clostridia bacterium]
MSVFESIVLGIVQGLTEFLPVSSSGHLVLLQNIFGMSEPQLFFDTMLHLGTLVAVVIVMWKNIVDLFKNFFSKFTLYLVVATIPALVFGFVFRDFFEDAFSGRYLGYGFLFTAVVLSVSEILATTIAKKRKLGFGSALAMGIMQAAAIFPGASRAGSTIAGGLAFGLDRKRVASFSFLMSIPVILGSVVLQSVEIAREPGVVIEWLPTVIGTVCAGIAGYFAVRFMLALIAKKRLYGFAIYVAILGIFVLLDQYVLGLINWAS